MKGMTKEEAFGAAQHWSKKFYNDVDGAEQQMFTYIGEIETMGLADEYLKANPESELTFAAYFLRKKNSTKAKQHLINASHHGDLEAISMLKDIFNEEITTSKDPIRTPSGEIFNKVEFQTLLEKARNGDAQAAKILEDKYDASLSKEAPSSEQPITQESNFEPSNETGPNAAHSKPNINDQPSLLVRTGIRFISPRFNDELTQWFSSVPFISAIMQVIASLLAVLYGLFKMLSITSESDSVRQGGCGASLLVLTQFALVILLFLAFISGLFSSLAMVGIVVQANSYVMPLFLGTCIIGTLLKNTLKVQAMGVNYEYKALYLCAIALAALLSVAGVAHIINIDDAKMLQQTGLDTMDGFFLPVVAIAATIIIFHGLLKPFLTNCLIIFVAIAVKADKETLERLKKRSEVIDHSMGMARKILAVIRYLVLFIAMVFVSVLTFSHLFGVSDNVLMHADSSIATLLDIRFDKRIPLSVVRQGLYPYILVFWLSIILWFAIMSAISPQKSLIAKVMRLFKRDSTKASKVIVTIGSLTLVATLFLLNADLHIFPNDPQTRLSNSVIYGQVNKSQILLERRGWRGENRLLDKPAWVTELAAGLYQQHKQAGTFNQLGLEKNSAQYYDRAYHGSKEGYYIHEIATRLIPVALGQYIGLLVVTILCVWLAIFLGIFTKDSRQLRAYAVSVLTIPVVCLYIATASNQLFIELKDYTLEVSEKLNYSFNTGDWGLRHYRKSLEVNQAVTPTITPAITHSNKASSQQAHNTNWNNVYLLPGENFSFDKLKIQRSYQQLITAARSGHSDAEIKVGMLYMHGVGVKQDFDKAKYWFNQAANDNHPQGLKMHGYTFYGSQNSEAFKYIRKAAQQGDVEAQYLTSKFYLEGTGVQIDNEKSEYWFNKAVANDIFVKH